MLGSSPLHLIQVGCATIGITPSSVSGSHPVPCCALQSELHKEKSIPDFQKKQLLVAFYSNLSHLHPLSAQAQGARPLAKLAVNSRGKQPWKSRKGAWLCWNILLQPPLARHGFHREETPWWDCPAPGAWLGSGMGGLPAVPAPLSLGITSQREKGMWEGGEYGAAPDRGIVQGAGMAGKTLGWGDADPLPLLKCHSYSMDYGGAEADEQSTGNI